MSKKINLGNVELRLNEDNSVDEVVIKDDNGKLLFHLEDMGAGGCWAKIEAPLVNGKDDITIMWQAELTNDPDIPEVPIKLTIGYEVNQ